MYGENLERYKFRYESLEISRQMERLKELYALFHAGGASKIGAFELCNNGCSITMMFYMVFSIFFIDWNCVFSEPSCDIFRTQNRMHSASAVQSSAFYMLWINILVMTAIVIWSSWSGWKKWKKAKQNEELILSQLGNWPPRWEPIQNLITESWPPLQKAQIVYQLNSEFTRLKTVFRICGIQGYNWKISRFLIWAIKSTLSITEDSVFWDESLNLGMHQIRVNTEESAKRIKIVALALFLSAPFFIFYFSIRLLVTQFYTLKTGRVHTEFKWTPGAHIRFCTWDELPHQTRERLGAIQKDVENLKKCRKRNLIRNHIGVYIHFCTSLVMMTLVIASLYMTILTRKYEWNDGIASAAGLLSALHLIGNTNDIKLTHSRILKLEKKVQKRTGANIKEVECYLNSRIFIIGKELLGILVTPFVLLIRVLPRLNDIRIAFELNNPDSDLPGDSCLDGSSLQHTLSDNSNFEYSDDSAFMSDLGRLSPLPLNGNELRRLSPIALRRPQAVQLSEIVDGN
jgi:hypothetical protein